MDRVQQGTSLVVEPVVHVLVVVCRTGEPARPWVRCCSDAAHATPSTRRVSAYTGLHQTVTGPGEGIGRDVGGVAR